MAVLLREESRVGVEEWTSDQTPNAVLTLSVVKYPSVKFPILCAPKCGPLADQATGNLPQEFENTHAGLCPV